MYVTNERARACTERVYNKKGRTIFNMLLLLFIVYYLFCCFFFLYKYEYERPDGRLTDTG